MSFTNVQTVDRRTMKFTLAPLAHKYANALRRLIQTGVETIAFRADIDEQGKTGDVVVETNDTPMTNEMLAHRISMLPINIKDPLRFKAEDYEFHLNITNDSDAMLDVVAGDFEVFNVSGDEPVRQNTASFFPANPLTGDTSLIAVLKSKTFGQAKGESIRLKAKAALGTGRMHAAFIPVSQAAYANTPDTDPDRRRVVFEAWLAASKKQTMIDLEKDDAKKAALEAEFDTMQAARCFLKDEKGEPYSYDFTIESVGPLPAEYIVRRACEVGETMCMRYATLDTGELPEDVTITPAPTEMLGFDLDFVGHDHTLRSILSMFLVENHIEGDAEPKIQFASGDCFHPLRDRMVLRIGVEDGQELTARQAVAAAARGCAELFRSLGASWRSATEGAPKARRAFKVPGAGADQTVSVRKV